MKKYVYFISIAYTTYADGSHGHGRGQHVLDEPITTLEQVKEIEMAARDSNPDIIAVATVTNFILLRVEDTEPITGSRWDWRN